MKRPYILALVIAAFAVVGFGCAPSGGDGSVYEIRVSIDTSTVSFFELVLEVIYDDGELCGSDRAVACSGIALDADSRFDDEENSEDPDEFVLRATLRKSGNGMQENNDIFRCTFVSPITPGNGSFDFRIISALNTAGSTVPAADLDKVRFDVTANTGVPGDCSGVATTTTTTTVGGTGATTSSTVTSSTMP